MRVILEIKRKHLAAVQRDPEKYLAPKMTDNAHFLQIS